MKIRNPIIRGFYPDPSICEANGKYYLACSSFQYFPGVPLFESSDLVNWKPIGHCLTRKNQTDLCQVPSSGGIFAPTLRFYNGTFYMVTNNNTDSRNFYVFTDHIYEEWSDPVFVDQEGIDPSLLFDNGRVYFTSNGNDHNGMPCILQCEIDIVTGAKLTETVPIWSGSGGRYPEAPHLYHIGKWYYLLAAEGGTEYGHMVTYARSENPYGPYEEYAKNPVLTNRNLGGNQTMIQGVGHGDLIKGPDGQYYMVCLGFRQSGKWQAYHHLGREVFLTQIDWQADGWFTAGEKGTLSEYPNLNLPHTIQEEHPYDLNFDISVFENPRWIFLRDYKMEHYCFRENRLFLQGTEVTLNDAASPTFTGVRQSEFFTHLFVTVGGYAEEAGVSFYMDECQHYDLFCRNEKGKKEVLLRLRIGDAEQIVSGLEVDIEDTPVLEVVSEPDSYSFYTVCKNKRHSLGKARSKYLSSEVAGGFTGVVMGLYAVDRGQAWADFRDLHWHQRSYPL